MAVLKHEKSSYHLSRRHINTEKWPKQWPNFDKNGSTSVKKKSDSWHPGIIAHRPQTSKNVLFENKFPTPSDDLTGCSREQRTDKQRAGHNVGDDVVGGEGAPHTHHDALGAVVQRRV